MPFNEDINWNERKANCLYFYMNPINNLVSFAEEPVKFVVTLPKEATVQESSDLTLTVELSRPRPAVWSKDGKPITEDNTHYTITSVDSQHTLIIHEVVIDDQAKYTIDVTGKKASTNVIVTGELQSLKHFTFLYLHTQGTSSSSKLGGQLYKPSTIH